MINTKPSPVPTLPSHNTTPLHLNNDSISSKIRQIKDSEKHLSASNTSKTSLNKINTSTKDTIDSRELIEPFSKQAKTFAKRLFQGHYGLIIGSFTIPIGLIMEFLDPYLNQKSAAGNFTRSSQALMTSVYGLSAKKVLSQTAPKKVNSTSKASYKGIKKDTNVAITQIDKHAHHANKILRNAFTGTAFMTPLYFGPVVAGTIQATTGFITPLLTLKWIKTAGFFFSMQNSVGVLRSGLFENKAAHSNQKALTLAKKDETLQKHERLLNIVKKDLQFKRGMAIKDIVAGTIFVPFVIFMTLKVWIANESLPKFLVNAKAIIYALDIILSIGVYMFIPFIQHKYKIKRPSAETAKMNWEQRQSTLEFEDKKEKLLLSFKDKLDAKYIWADKFINQLVNSDGLFHTPMKTLITKNVDVTSMLEEYVTLQLNENPNLNEADKLAYTDLLTKLQQQPINQRNIQKLDGALIQTFNTLSQSNLEKNNTTNEKDKTIDERKQLVKFLFTDALKHSYDIKNGIKTLTAQEINVKYLNQ